MMEIKKTQETTTIPIRTRRKSWKAWFLLFFVALSSIFLFEKALQGVILWRILGDYRWSSNQNQVHTFFYSDERFVIRNDKNLGSKSKRKIVEIEPFGRKVKSKVDAFVFLFFKL